MPLADLPGANGLLDQTIKRDAEAEATPNNFADSIPTTRLLRFVKPYCS